MLAQSSKCAKTLDNKTRILLKPSPSRLQREMTFWRMLLIPVQPWSLLPRQLKIIPISGGLMWLLKISGEKINELWLLQIVDKVLERWGMQPDKLRPQEAPLYIFVSVYLPFNSTPSDLTGLQPVLSLTKQQYCPKCFSGEKRSWIVLHIPWSSWFTPSLGPIGLPLSCHLKDNFPFPLANTVKVTDSFFLAPHDWGCRMIFRFCLEPKLV